ncbi:MAG: 5-guanidino-2-oxopentanoate decarboxylase [Alphaproteobacteria bacterium]|nr:5-guanidino-2-oxopentanoate decarboxylase [Alphaproteobacteria bacterium]
MKTIAGEVVAQLAQRGVRVVFGIPGVHTLELYRGLAAAGIRHVTARHEQGAGFMADGYARATGEPGVALVITGPGLTNTLTAMAQARADSVPMIVVSGVNTRPSLGRGLGFLHELPDQRGVARLVALRSERIETAADVVPMVADAFEASTAARPGPSHIEVPLDVAAAPFTPDDARSPQAPAPLPDYRHGVGLAAEQLRAAERVVILAGGGVRHASQPVQALAERLDAPVVQTINARGLLHQHPLGVPASPSLEAVRALIADADVVLALGTELGPTDYDMYATGTMAPMANLIRVDICAAQLERHPASLTMQAPADTITDDLLSAIDSSAHDGSGADRAARARAAALEEIGPEMRSMTALLECLRDTLPGAYIVGDSAQPVYAGNLYYDHDRPGGWFNAATGFGALGYAIPAAIGVALGKPGETVVCLTGDGGAQFTLSELMVARDENLPIVFLIWNNHGYHEIETSMEAVDMEPVGCDPSPPDFEAVAASCGLTFERCAPDAEALAAALRAARERDGASIVEIRVA